jgi:hypothetical protein
MFDKGERKQKLLQRSMRLSGPGDVNKTASCQSSSIKEMIREDSIADEV